MTDADWCRECRRLHEPGAVKIIVDAAMLKDRLAVLDALMRKAPWSILSNFELIDEDRLAAGCITRSEQIESGVLGWDKMPVAARQTLETLAIEIRAYDELLARLNSRYNRIPADPSAEWRTSDGSAFVIPSRRGRDLGSRAGDGLSYGRRGTLMHRVVPATLDGMAVRPVTLAALEARPGSGAVPLGAALFPGMTLRTRESSEGFVAIGVEHPDVPAALDRQLAALSGTVAMVWPELTLDDGALDHLASALARLSLERDDVPDVIVAGSWHRERGEAMRNVAPVLDGTGAGRDEYSKVVIFQSDDLGPEDIEAGTEILVIACDRFLATVAICKDYCGLGSGAPWHRLDVDILLIPSMGGATTMEGHLVRAHQDRIEHGSRAFVVQQGVKRTPSDPDGFVLPASDKPPKDAADVASNEEWKRADM